MKKLLILLLVLFINFQAKAQNLVSSEFLQSISKSELETQYPTIFHSGVDLYRILYESHDVHGQLDTASGLLVIPDNPNFIYPLLNYQHGTVGSRWDVPSQLAGGYDLATVFGGMGYATVAPDFLGLGEARGFHPYVHAETEARAAIDMLFAARQFADENDNLTLNDQLFITGYSQGGHAAAAAHKYIQQDYPNDFTVTASAPMSGPYSISEKMVEFTLGEEEYFFVGYLAYVALSYNLAYGNLYNDLSEFFKPNYVNAIQQFANEEIDLGDLTFSLISTLIANEGPGQVKPKHLLQDSILNIILNEPNHPISMALADNDLIDWVPNAPTRLVYCTADDQVYYQNAVLAESTMNANGASDLESYDADPSADHGGCVQPAVIFTLLFFANYQQMEEIVGTKGILSENPLMEITPNPVADQLFIKLIDSVDSFTNYDIQVLNANGQLMYRTEMSGKESTTIPTSHWSPGIYLINTTGAKGNFSQKIMVERN